MNKRKVLTLALTACIVAILAIGGTLAYFTDTEDATNTFTVGNVNITLTEPHWTSTGSQDAPEVYPGEPLAKDPTVTNTGANPCFVRVKVEGLDCLGNAGMITTRYQYVNEYNTTDWTLYNGYYYYNHVLTYTGDTYNTDLKVTTTPVFDQIVIPTGLENGNPTTEYNVVVTAEAVQAQGAKASWSQVKTMTVADIAAWFATCGL